ncbi:protein arginine kinase [Caldisalinibacter kiritimatiensis]|uniref:Protein-arginine kinase n=1 Tax=Caldisalinibacter kiritimatiensis TaxID=1304284 RepID=R1AVF8_9FIRM|nr:protein arginine kinase [Caldisalinibacter kiritimatiensis]EOD00642.1 Putative ATP:guanido phosphotransferase YacI [Caldisalinibacter kiritimatiensis]
MVKWLEGKGPESDIVVSSRIRLARNLEDINFPQMITKEAAESSTQRIKDAILSSNSVLTREFEFKRLREISELDRNVLVEKHLISHTLLERPQIGSFLLSKDEKVTIMINEEDHIRMQVLLPGLRLEEGWDLCSKIDDVLEERLKYAFDEKLGYLTSCPTNVGTGMRASVMVHLPALVLTGTINKVLQAVTQIGLTVRGLYGEGTNAMGNLFQISNQITLGESEEKIIEKLKNVVLQIINKERKAREKLLNSNKVQIEDKVYRSLGILKSARIISSKEAMKLLSNVKMGIDMGIIDEVDKEEINKLMITVQPANIQKRAMKELTQFERDIKRAELIREKL